MVIAAKRNAPSIGIPEDILLLCFFNIWVHLNVTLLTDLFMLIWLGIYVEVSTEIILLIHQKAGKIKKPEAKKNQ